MSNINISLFKPSKQGKPGLKPISTDFYTEMSKIQDGTYYAVVKELREITDPVLKREFKAAKLDGITISAKVTDKREIKNCSPSGLLCIDLDPKGNPNVTDWEEVRDLLFELPEVVSSFITASGQGVAFVVKIDPSEFKDVFYSIMDELRDNFDLQIDPGCHDISRLRFSSYDAGLKLRTDFESIPLKHPSSLYLEKKRTRQERVTEYDGAITSADCDRAFNYAEKATEKKIGMFSDGVKHSYLVSLAGFCNYIGMSQGYLEAEVQKRYGGLTDITTERLLKPIRNVYKAYPHRHNQFANQARARKTNSKIIGEVVTNYVHKGIKPSEEQLDEIAQKVEANIEQVRETAERVIAEYSEEFNVEAKAEIQAKGFKQFWYLDDDNEVCLSRMAFRDFLKQNGIFRYEIEKDWILIQINENVVEEIQKAHLKQLVFNYVEKLKEYQVWEALANRVNSVFSDEYLEVLPVKQVEFYRDKKDSLCLFYLNGVVEITKLEITFHTWAQFHGYVWKNQIIQRETTLQPTYDQPVKSDFQKFLQNITKKDSERFNAMITAIGYMLHNYKDKSLMPAVVLNDEVISDDPAGGTGKGIIVDCLKRFRNVEVLDGKTFDFSDRFCFQNITLETDIIYFDDVRKNFPFELLFSSLTEGFSVERKGFARVRIPFNLSPKIILSTNYALPGGTDSFDRRKNELEICQYYSKKFTPKHEFKKLLFDEFSPEEYNIFDNFIFRCCGVYMQLGLVEQTLINQPLKQLYASTDKDFVDYMDEEYSVNKESIKHHPYKIDQVEAYGKYQKLYPSKLGSKTFYRFMEKYFKYHEVEYVRHKSGDIRYFYIGGIF